MENKSGKCTSCKHRIDPGGWAACDGCIHDEGLKDRYEPMTNADRIRNMTDEELAKPYLETPFKCYIYCTNARPFLVWGDVFRGTWVTEFTRLSGYGRAEADRTWDVFNGHVAGEFVCDWVETIKAATEPYGIYDVGDYFVAQTRLVDGALWDYGKGATLYGWHISNLKIYDTPKPLSAFKGLCKIDVGCGELV